MLLQEEQSPLRYVSVYVSVYVRVYVREYVSVRVSTLPVPR